MRTVPASCRRCGGRHFFRRCRGRHLQSSPRTGRAFADVPRRLGRGGSGFCVASVAASPNRGHCLTRHWQRWGPISGLLLASPGHRWPSPFHGLPDLGSAQRGGSVLAREPAVDGAGSVHQRRFPVPAAVSGRAGRTVPSGRRRPAPRSGRLASVLMFKTALNVALGLDIAAGLLVDTHPSATPARCTPRPSCSPRRPAAGAGSSSRSRALSGTPAAPPRWTAWLAVVGVEANVGAVLGTLSLTGPLNSGNGIGGDRRTRRLPAWILSVSLWWLIGGKPTAHVHRTGRTRPPTFRSSTLLAAPTAARRRCGRSGRRRPSARRSGAAGPGRG